MEKSPPLYTSIVYINKEGTMQLRENPMVSDSSYWCLITWLGWSTFVVIIGKMLLWWLLLAGIEHCWSPSLMASLTLVSKMKRESHFYAFALLGLSSVLVMLRKESCKSAPAIPSLSSSFCVLMAVAGSTKCWRMLRLGFGTLTVIVVRREFMGVLSRGLPCCVSCGLSFRCFNYWYQFINLWWDVTAVAKC